MIARSLSFSVLALSLAACGDSASKDQGSSKPSSSVSAKPSSAVSAMINKPKEVLSAVASAVVPIIPGKFAAMSPLVDDEIAQTVVTLNQGEIDQADAALKATKNADVKMLATHMKEQHTDWLKDAKDLASKEKLNAKDNAISKQLKADTDDVLKKLGGEKDADFDKDYVDAQVKGHQDALDLIDQRLSKDVKNAALSKAIADVRPKIADHLKMAKDVQSKLSSGAGAASSATPAASAAPSAKK